MAQPTAAWVAWALQGNGRVAELDALELAHPDWPSPLRLVTGEGQELKPDDGVARDFEGADFLVTPPAAAVGELVAELEVVVASHAAELYRRLALLPAVERGSSLLTLSWWRFLADDLAAPSWVPGLVGRVVEAQATMTQVTLRAATDYPDNVRSGLYYTSDAFPWVADLEAEA